MQSGKVLLLYHLLFVILQAVQYFHRQVGDTVAAISEQYAELLGSNNNSVESLSHEQMLAEVMGGLNVSGRYFTIKEQMKVRLAT